MYSMEETSWGNRVVVGDDPVTEILTINSGCMLKLKLHQNYRKILVPQGTGLILYTQYHTSWGNNEPYSKVMQAGNAYSVLASHKYRIINPSEYSIKIVECIDGVFDPEDIQVF